MTIATLPDGARIWYRKSGSGPPLLHIHGSAFGHANFSRLTPLLAPHFEVIDFDLPGYGDSSSPQAITGFEGFAQLVRDLIGELGYPKVSIHGTSFGAMIALTLAAQHPSVVDRLVLSCFLARYDAAARMMRATWKRAAREIGMDAVADLTSVAGFARGFYEQAWAEGQLASMRQAFRRTAPEAFCAGTEMIERSDLSARVLEVTSQMLLLAGAEDNMTPFSPAASGFGFEQILAQRPSARCEIVERCGHYLVLEQPETAAALITRWMQEPAKG